MLRNRVNKTKGDGRKELDKQIDREIDTDREKEIVHSLSLLEWYLLEKMTFDSRPDLVKDGVHEKELDKCIVTFASYGRIAIARWTADLVSMTASIASSN